MIDALDIHVKGIVQGVGFRPFVYRLAKKYLISGWVLNAIDGVHIRAEGESEHVDAFVMELSENAPAAAQVSEIDIAEVPIEPFEGFEIRFSEEESAETTFVSPDLAICDQCLSELFDGQNRRFRYPFINCTNCGPRFTIIESLPYDRSRTSMRGFAMCSACELEYDTPTDRRFHAQPNACFECGPHISWSTDGGKNVKWGLTRQESDEIIASAVKMLREGAILAVKGLGGYHLVCDAVNADAVERLRERKRRFGKAFAIMVENKAAAERFCHVSDEEAAILEGPVRPIVLLKKRASGNAALDGAFGASDIENLTCAVVLDETNAHCHLPGVADGLGELGIMLPYTPVQALLMNDFAATQGSPDELCALVMTSGNVHDEPICIKDDEAFERLSGIADAFLGNDREILSRYDDSVVRVIKAGGAGDAIQMIRRARGYAPTPISFTVPGTQDGGSGDIDFSADGGCGDRDVSASDREAILAVGPEQKNTFTLMRAGEESDIKEAFVSQHIGDLENADTFAAWLEAKDRLEQLFEFSPNKIACDLHPEYIATKWAHERSELEGLELVEVQHHHAHIASVIAECGLPSTEAICGFAFDGTGYGVDGNIWGGEVLLANMGDFERFANFAYVPMPGGAAAIKNPLQMAYGVLWAFDLLDHPGANKALDALGKERCETLSKMIENAVNSPSTSSVGRLFDAASALLGICTDPSYEGEPAIMLEAAMGASSADRETAAGEADNGDLETAEAYNGDSETAEATCAATEGGAPYSISIIKNTATPESTAHDTSVVLLDAAPLFKAMLDDIAAGVSVQVIAKKFHDAFVEAIVSVAQLVLAMYDIGTVALSGGVFMNRYLIENSISALEQAGFTVAINRELPPNDGCASFGEAVVSLFKA